MNRHSYLVVAALVLATACGSESTSAGDPDGGPDGSAGSDPSQAPPLEAKWRGTMEVSPDNVKPGDRVAIRFPDGRLHGIAFALEGWNDDAWQTRFYLSSDGGSLNWTPSWWSADDAEGHGWPDIGVQGPGPDHVVVPDSAAAGTYRLCTANTREKACALVSVSESSGQPDPAADPIEPGEYQDVRWEPLPRYTDGKRTDSHVVFGRDGTYTGSDGCNGQLGTYSLSPEGDLAADPEPQTLIGCLGVGINGALERSDRVTLDGGRLTLYDGAEVVLALTPAKPSA